MQQHDDLDILLKRRAAPQPQNDLAERIIHAAVSQMQRRAQTGGFWSEILSMLLIPHPSVAVATGIILGLVIGAQAGDGLFILQQDWASFLYVNEGGWL